MSNDLPAGWQEVIGTEVAEYMDDIQQIKEKFGKLRIYWKHNLKTSHILRSVAEDKWSIQCSITCMHCVNSAIKFNDTGWIGPVCKEHYDE